MRVLYCGNGWLPIVDAIRARVPGSVEVVIRDHQRPLHDQLGDVHVILPSHAPIGPRELDVANQLRLIQQVAVGVERIDGAEAEARAIPVCNAPGTNAQSVAEGTILLLLACARRLRIAERMFRAAVVGEPLGIELSQKTLGLVGCGDQGSRVRRLAEAFEMRVSWTDSKSSRAEFLAMLAQSDFVSIHCRLDERTRHLFDDDAFQAMKAGAYLINVSRGGVIEESALRRALPRLGGVAFDVFWREPWDPNDPLFADPKVIALPHCTGSTEEAYGRISALVAENIRRLDTGEPLLHRVW